MELHPGVFVSDVATEEWEPDPDVPGTEMHILVDSGGVQAGLTRITKGDAPLPWTPPVRELILVLEGAVRIEIANGPTLELEVGGVASLPAGVETTWQVTRPFKELWVLA